MIGLSKPFMDILAVDIGKNSLQEAQQKTKKFKIQNIHFRQIDLVKDTLPINYFDITFSIGVIHHIQKSELVLEKLVKSTKTGGIIIIGVYNPYGILKNRIKRKIVHFLGGDDIEKRVTVAKLLFVRKQTTHAEEVMLADSYAHPYQRYFTIEQMLSL